MVESKASNLSSHLPAVCRQSAEGYLISLLVVSLARTSHFCLSWFLRSDRLDVLALLCPSLSCVSNANHTSTVVHAGQVPGSTSSGDLHATTYSPTHLCLQS